MFSKILKILKCKKKSYHYWVTYSYKNYTEMGTGACEMLLGPKKCTSIEDIYLFRDNINGRQFNNNATVVITNLIYLRKGV